VVKERKKERNIKRMKELKTFLLKIGQS
jgi:hypothetical protein